MTFSALYNLYKILGMGGTKTTLTEDDDIKKRWAQYCEQLYKKDPTDQELTAQTSNHLEPPPLRSEVETALKDMANGKSPGIDDIPAELWKSSGETGIDLLWILCKKIWNDQVWPKDWCRSVYVTIHKKREQEGVQQLPHHQPYCPCK